MKKIPSFEIDHTRLDRGVYVSRVDELAPGVHVTTFDVRMKQPNREEPLDIGALHTIEHLVATYLRNQAEWGSRVVYWGPMGCLTGCYLLMAGRWLPADVLGLLREAFEFVVSFRGEVPGVTARDCGNYRLHNLPVAQLEAQAFLQNTLLNPSPGQLVYPA